MRTVPRNARECHPLEFPTAVIILEIHRARILKDRYSSKLNSCLSGGDQYNLFYQSISGLWRSGVSCFSRPAEIKKLKYVCLFLLKAHLILHINLSGWYNVHKNNFYGRTKSNQKFSFQLFLTKNEPGILVIIHHCY